DDACDPMSGCYNPPHSCNDSNPCTDDACSSQTGCVYTNNTAPCDDSNFCTTGETCSGGLCQGGIPVVCNDNNVCTTDSCDPRTGACTNPPAPNGTACNDGNPCTVGDVCTNGVCGGSLVVAPAETQNMAADADKVTFRWSPASDATAYDALRGLTGPFPVGS